jgi:hypothetical protein
VEGCGIRDELIAEADEAVVCKKSIVGSSPTATSIFLLHHMLLLFETRAANRNAQVA